MLVSVLTPTYNHEKYISQCVNSVLKQTYSSWEQIIVDDGSHDNTANLIREFQDPRIRYSFQENKGPYLLANTYNVALGKARGSLIAILEGDDFWPPDKLASLIHAFSDENVVMAYGERADVDAMGRRQRRRTDTARSRIGIDRSVLSNNPVGSITVHMLTERGRSLISPCTVVIRRSALDRIGGFQAVRGLPLTDYPTFLELSLQGTFYYSPKILGYLRRHEHSITVCHARAIDVGVSAFADDFMEKHFKTLRLSERDRVQIHKTWVEASERLHFSEGRTFLLQKRWKQAREHFRIALKCESVKVRAAACVGILLSHLHINMEIIMRLGGRSDLRTTVANHSRSELQNV